MPWQSHRWSTHHGVDGLEGIATLRIHKLIVDEELVRKRDVHVVHVHLNLEERKIKAGINGTTLKYNLNETNQKIVRSYFMWVVKMIWYTPYLSSFLYMV